MRFFCALALCLAACGQDTAADSATPSTLPKACNDGAAPDTYVAGLARPTVDNAFTVTLEDALPAPPDVGLNTFTVTVDAPTGSSIRMRPYMPLHGHGSSPEWWTGTESAGTWTFADVNLHMAGLWELRFTVDSDDADTGALFRFCLEG